MTTPPLLPPEFEYRRADVAGVTVNCAIAGSGPPVLLLHGYPENHLMWRQVAPALAEDHTVVLADLRGYGDSGKPAPDAAGTPTPSGPWPATRWGSCASSASGRSSWSATTAGPASRTGWRLITPKPSPGSPSWTSCRPGMS